MLKLPQPMGEPRSASKSCSKASFREAIGFDAWETDVQRSFLYMEDQYIKPHVAAVHQETLEMYHEQYPHAEDKPAISSLPQGWVESAVQKVREKAPPAIKAWYDHWNKCVPRTEAKKEAPDWAIRWYLWHKFRHTDKRNTGRRRRELRSDSDIENESQSTDGGPDMKKGSPEKRRLSVAGGLVSDKRSIEADVGIDGTKYYDPVRGRYVDRPGNLEASKNGQT